MATIVLSAVGMAAGGMIGGTAFGLSSAIMGRAIGATLGRVIDQKIMGNGSQVVETGRIERFRLTGASEGAPIGQIYGRMRLAGQIIWASKFQEHVSTTGGGKGSSPTPKTTEFSYSVSIAVALCEGEISRVGRVWADGVEVARDELNMRVYRGDLDQLPDPKIEAVEGVGNAPAYRGTAYVVFENLPLAMFGNRVPQFTFEVMRPSQKALAGLESDMTSGIRGVALMPGSGEYALATTPVYFEAGLGESRSVNVNSPSGKTDLATSVEALREELPNCKSVSLIVSWFGDDLRCGQCALKPKVEQLESDGTGMPWSVSGVERANAEEIVRENDRPIYGGSPTDLSVIEAISEIRNGGQDIVYYPFILMEQMEGNAKFDPWTGAGNQPVLPWRGRITLSAAPGQPGSPDQTSAADAEVAAFFGSAAVADFSLHENGVNYTGPNEWSYRRFILHNAHLAAVAGGVDAFCIGSEMRGLTQIRGEGRSFPAVEALRILAADVRAILGPDCKIGYAADWSEYFGYQPQDGSGDRYFHLDPLWSDANIDFIGIDNYMPLSDWRDGENHADSDWGSIYNLDYLKSNIAGGEGYDWYYHSPEAEAAQIRTPITDGAYDEPWIYRYKDIANWWSNAHHERIGGVRQAESTDWVPSSKPVWFTELGCAAINKGTNQPNKFLDPKSSESRLPKYSNGMRDDLVQMQYLRAMIEFWDDDQNNPISEIYGGPMIDMSRAHVWAWDARPYPFFPNNRDLWSDGGNYSRGHWLNGRTSARSLESVVAEICERSGVTQYDVSSLYGFVRGYSVGDVDGARSALQPLMLAFGFDAIERNGTLVFQTRNGRVDRELDLDWLAVTGDQENSIEALRSPIAEVAGRIRLNFVESESDYEIRAAEAIFPDEATSSISQTELSLAMTQTEGRGVAERWLAESRISRDSVRFALPPSQLELGAGDIVSLPTEMGAALYRLDQVEQSGALIVEAVRVEPEVYEPSDAIEEVVQVRSFSPAVPTSPLFLDLPLLYGEEVPHAPHMAVTARPWPGSVAVFSSSSDNGYELNRLIDTAATVGVTQTPLLAWRSGLIERAAPLRVKLVSGTLSSESFENVLNGANAAAIGDASSSNWEVFQFTDVNFVGEDIYEISGRLRGQLGTDAIIPDVWPVGSRFVLLNKAVQQIEVSMNARGLARHYRIGPAQRSYDDPSYIHRVEAFEGVGLRPYSPTHLRAKRASGGALFLSWIRRTRIDGDSWESVEVPLGETYEAYLIRVKQNGTILREVTVSAPEWTYPMAMQTNDLQAGPVTIEVAQLSERFGAGPFKGIEIND